MLGTEADFRHYLQSEFIRRCQSNRSYSLRAFARSLHIESSALSKILRGTRSLTPKMHIKLGSRLGLASHEITSFKSFKIGEQKRIRGAVLIKPDYHQLSVDAFQVIADWYHHAILEMLKLNQFKQDHRWIARKLAISVNEAHIAIERLIRLGLLTVTPNGKWKLAYSRNSTTDKTQTHVAAKRLQEQVLQMSLKALQEVPFNERVHSSMTMAIDSSKLDEAKELITKFRRDLCEYMQKSARLDHVYQLAVNLYPLTQKISFSKETQS